MQKNKKNKYCMLLMALLLLPSLVTHSYAAAPSWFQKQKDKCSKPSDGLVAAEGGCCIYDKDGNQLAHSVVGPSEVTWFENDLKERCAQYMTGKNGDYFGLWVCTYGDNDVCHTWDWWFGEKPGV